ncbi:ABC transporter ATP-binding protein [Actinomyces gerencseriae]|uniref:ABC transporter ATP-binding protein n=1 Tax=Actinomyces gerencseriae TaxID=52769 RepID=UPI00041A5333|nr:ABC transporter ATP-binding protein [Actinomyces gerencseriae]
MSDDTGDIDGTAGEPHDGGGSGAVLGEPGAAAGGPGGGGGSCRDSAAAAGPAGAAGARGGEPASAGLSLRGLRVVYRGTRGAARVTAVDGVDLDVSRGETVALLGPSGCGKSSLLRAVAGLEDLAGGTVMWDGRDVVRVPVHRRGFGLMLQDGQLFPFRDVAGNVAYGLTGLPRRERRPRVEEMLELVGLPGYGPRDIATLSGGQAQRVALARSLAPRPRLLLLDEPLSALDRALREQLAVDLREILAGQGTTALYVTHDHGEARVVADRVGVMDAGRLLRLDAPEALWADPGDETVARFLGLQGAVAGPH